VIRDRKILAIVPARSGSKGIPNKNMRMLGGVSLIGLAGICLSELPWLDAKVLTTDSPEYAAEGRRYGLAVPFLRPAELSSDTAGALETMTHALQETERHTGDTFDAVLIVEPTSPLRTSGDIESATTLLLDSGADSVVSVSALPAKSHPAKVLKIGEGRLGFYEDRGSRIVNRQVLESLYWRNGVCYALTRKCLLERKAIFTENTLPLVIGREIVNIDDPVELDVAELLLERSRR
jgi:CMP-N,N'-diacetyllegionaminic acid synthase